MEWLSQNARATRRQYELRDRFAIFWCGHKQRLDHGKMQCESFMLSIVKGIKPIDQLETMLETQISALAKRRILPNACRRFWSCWRGPKTRLKNQ
jgi:hypothetical protein